ncbi:MAG: hypothetical protein EBY14_03250, partial [Betaproteobacteria bacterium]|nr:hypothetical protein [Betaproteobacteria bacterium]
MQELGAGEILLTSMDRDGTRVGFDIELTRTFSDMLEIPGMFWFLTEHLPLRFG